MTQITRKTIDRDNTHCSWFELYSIWLQIVYVEISNNLKYLEWRLKWRIYRSIWFQIIHVEISNILKYFKRRFRSRFCHSTSFSFFRFQKIFIRIFRHFVFSIAIYHFITFLLYMWKTFWKYISYFRNSSRLMQKTRKISYNQISNNEQNTYNIEILNKSRKIAIVEQNQLSLYEIIDNMNASVIYIYIYI